MSKRKLLPHEAIVIEEFAIEAIVKGYSNSELKDLLTESYGNMATSEELEKVAKEAHAAIRDNTLTDLDKIIPRHIEIYEKVYKEMDELFCVPGKLRAMRLKESLVGMHKEVNTVDVYNEVNIEIEREPEYDMRKLSTEEAKKLNKLFDKIYPTIKKIKR